MTKLLRTQHGVVLDVGQLMAIDPQENKDGTYWLAAVMKSGDDFMLMKPTSDVELRAKVFERIVVYWTSHPKEDVLLSVRDLLDGALEMKAPSTTTRASSIKPTTIGRTAAGAAVTSTTVRATVDGDHVCSWYVMLTSEKTGAPTAWECFEHETRLREHPAQDCETPSCCSGEDPF